MQLRHFLRFCAVLVFCSSFAHADDGAQKKCGFVQPFDQFMHSVVHHDTGGFLAQEKCVKDFFDAREAKNNLEIQSIEQQIKKLQVELKKVAYEDSLTIVVCDPKNGNPPDPKKNSAKCHALNNAINGLIDRERQLSHWDDDFRHSVTAHTVTDDPNSLPPAAPPPDTSLCAKLKVARGFSGDAMDQYYTHCVGN